MYINSALFAVRCRTLSETFCSSFDRMLDVSESFECARHNDPIGLQFYYNWITILLHINGIGGFILELNQPLIQWNSVIDECGVLGLIRLEGQMKYQAGHVNVGRWNSKKI